MNDCLARKAKGSSLFSASFTQKKSSLAFTALVGRFEACSIARDEGACWIFAFKSVGGADKAIFIKRHRQINQNDHETCFFNFSHG
jgi:hypothetical protein